MDQNISEPFATENSGTARFIGLDNGESSGAACSNSGTISASHEFQTIKPGNSQKQQLTNRTEIPHSELVKMLYYLEGELQARDIVIAALRNERVKHYITQLNTKRIQPNDPYAAIFRDKITLAGNLISRESSMQAAQAEMEVRQIIEQQMEQQYQMVNKQRATHLRMVNILTESLENNQRMLQELEEEKRKHEHDTAQGDDITYGLELERTKLRQELDEERAQLKKMEKEMKKLQETLDYERNRQKQIVLLLIAERKKILMKYIEEGKRSEDLAQILAEEKQRSDTIAEGLEEESKKSLRMEEELEKQAAAFDKERKALSASLVREELRVKELEQEINQLKSENEALKKQQLQLQHNVVVSNTAKARGVFNEDVTATPMVNIAKIVQPTATVSSVPVSVPTTGIARSIIPGQNIRNTITTTPAVSVAGVSSSLVAGTSNDTIATTPIVAQSAPSPAKMQPTATIQRAPGAKFSTAHSMDQSTPHAVPIAVPPVTVPPTGARGAPPPIPPNKPIVPPKREPSRLGSIAGAAITTSVPLTSAATTSNINSKIN